MKAAAIKGLLRGLTASALILALPVGWMGGQVIANHIERPRIELDLR